MKVKNAELGAILGKLNSLKGLFLAGDVSLAVVDLKEQIQSKLGQVEKAMIDIAESICTKGEDGKALKETRQDSKGTYIEYKFPTPEFEEKFKDEVSKLQDGESELSVTMTSMSREAIITMKGITPDQVEALLILCPPKLTKA